MSLDITKKVSFFSLMVISIVSSINMAILYWLPIQIPTSMHLTTSLLYASFALKAYYLIPFSFLICMLLFFGAWSFYRERIALPIISICFLLCDLAFLVCSFFSALIYDEHFIWVQALQIIISVFAITVMLLYLILLRKEKTATQGV